MSTHLPVSAVAQAWNGLDGVADDLAARRDAREKVPRSTCQAVVGMPSSPRKRTMLLPQ